MRHVEREREATQRLICRHKGIPSFLPLPPQRMRRGGSVRHILPTGVSRNWHTETDNENRNFTREGSQREPEFRTERARALQTLSASCYAYQASPPPAPDIYAGFSPQGVKLKSNPRIARTENINVRLQGCARKAIYPANLAPPPDLKKKNRLFLLVVGRGLVKGRLMQGGAYRGGTYRAVSNTVVNCCSLHVVYRP